MLGIFGKRAAQRQNNDALQDIRQLMHDGAQAQERGQADIALQAYERGLALSRERQQRQAEQTFLNSIGAVYVGLQRHADAETQFNQALDLARDLDEPVLVARSLNNLGELFAAQEQWAKAQEYHEQALDTARPTSDAPTIILTLENLARDYMQQDNPNYATHLLKEAVTMAQIKQDSYLGIGVLGRLGEATIETGDTVAGRKLIDQAIRLSMNSDSGRPRLVMRWLIKLGELDVENRQYHEALRHFQRAEEVAAQFGVNSSDFFLKVALLSAECYLNQGNFGAALDQAQRAQMHAQQLGQDDVLARLNGTLGLSLQGVGEHAQAREKLTEALHHYEQGQLKDQNEYARLLLALGRSQQQVNDDDGALQTYRWVLDMLDPEDNPSRRAEALKLIAAVQNSRGDREAAIQQLLEAERLFRAASELHKVARVLCDLGSTRKAKGDVKGAITDIENALMLLSSIEDRITRGLVLSNAAILYTETGDIDTAQSFYKESIQLAKDLGDKYAESVRTGNFGWLQLSIGRYSTAIETLSQAIDMSRELQEPLLLGIQMNNLGWANFLDGKVAEGKRILEQALSHVESVGSQQWRGVVRSNLGALLLEQGQLDDATEMLQAALQDNEDSKDDATLIRTRIRWARLRYQRGEPTEAETKAEELEIQARKQFLRKEHGDTLALLGDINASQRQAERAKYFYNEAARIYTMIRDPLADKMRQKAEKF
jgi:tetratricopeptide (TPR) repeat protein